MRDLISTFTSFYPLGNGLLVHFSGSSDCCCSSRAQFESRSRHYKVFTDVRGSESWLHSRWLRWLSTATSGASLVYMVTSFDLDKNLILLSFYLKRLVYAYVTDSMFPLFATQVFGQLAANVYNIVYYRWSVPEKRKELRKLYAWSFAAHCGLSLYTILGLLGATYQSNSDVGTYLGYVGIVIDVWMFGSPLGTLKHVMETKSAASIPINLSLMLFVSTSLCVNSGMVDSDYFVAGLNAIRSILSIVQIVFYMIYRPKGDQDSVLEEFTEPVDEVSVVITPTAKTKTDVVSIQSPAYQIMVTPRAS